jgi:hypothetical protein
MFTEYARCYKNPEYCIENYFKIYDKIQEKSYLLNYSLVKRSVVWTREQ